MKRLKSMLLRAVAAIVGVGVLVALAGVPSANAQEPVGIDLTLDIVSGEPGLILDAYEVGTDQDAELGDGDSAVFLVGPESDQLTLNVVGPTSTRDLFRLRSLDCEGGNVMVTGQANSPVPGMLTDIEIRGVGLGGLAECVLRVDRGIDATLTVDVQTTNGDTTTLFDVDNIWFPETMPVAGGSSVTFPANRVASFGVAVRAPDATWARDSVTCTDPGVDPDSGGGDGQSIVLGTFDGITSDVTCTVVFGPAGAALTIANATADESSSFTIINMTSGVELTVSGDSSVSVAGNETIELQMYAADGWVFSSLDCDVALDSGGIQFPKQAWIVLPGLASAKTCTITLDPVDAVPVVSDPATEVIEALSCVAGNGRLDYNIVNRSEAAAVYRVQIGALAARQFNVQAGEWWRSPVTGRRDGPISVQIFKDDVLIVDHTAHVSCDNPDLLPFGTPEVQVFVFCTGGNGLVFGQFVNPTFDSRPYVIDVGGLRRSQTAFGRAAAVRGVSGRADGVYEVDVLAAGQLVYSTTVTVACD